MQGYWTYSTPYGTFEITQGERSVRVFFRNTTGTPFIIGVFHTVEDALFVLDSGKITALSSDLEMGRRQLPMQLTDWLFTPE